MLGVMGFKTSNLNNVIIFIIAKLKQCREINLDFSLLVHVVKKGLVAFECSFPTIRIQQYMDSLLMKILYSESYCMFLMW